MAELKIGNIVEFAEEIKAELEKRYDVSVLTKQCVKNNMSTHLALLIAEGNENVRPSIYLEHYYEMYVQEGFEAALNSIWEVYEFNRIREHIDISVITNYEKVKHSLCAWLVNYDMNKEQLRNIPHRRFLDLAIVAYVDVRFDKPSGMNGTVWVTNEMQKMWGITDAEIIDRALSNIKNDADMIEINQYLKENGFELGYDVTACDLDIKVYILTNKKKYRGAINMTNKDILRVFAASSVGEKYIYIIPSSIHEVLLLPTDSIKGVDGLKKLVEHVNESEINDEEILSNNVYMYDVETNELTIA